MLSAPFSEAIQNQSCKSGWCVCPSTGSCELRQELVFHKTKQRPSVTSQHGLQTLEAQEKGRLNSEL